MKIEANLTKVCSQVVTLNITEEIIMNWRTNPLKTTLNKRQFSDLLAYEVLLRIAISYVRTAKEGMKIEVNLTKVHSQVVSLNITEEIIMNWRTNPLKTTLNKPFISSIFTAKRCRPRSRRT